MNLKKLIPIFAIFLFFITLCMIIIFTQNNRQYIKYNDFINYLSSGDIKTASFVDKSINFNLKDNSRRILYK